MKTLAFVLLAATVMVSCKKSEDQPSPLTSPGVVAKIAGSQTDYGVPMAERQQSTGGTETIFISASTQDGKSIEISLSKDGGIAAGTYGKSNSAFIGVSDGTDFYETDNTVSVQVTAVDATHIVGFFSGTAGDGTTNKAVTEGKFYANF
jgi:hypothetical protein